MAPEVPLSCNIEGIGYTVAIDWWSFGITMFYLFYGRTPFRKILSQDDGYFVLSKSEKDHKDQTQPSPHRKHTKPRVCNFLDPKNYTIYFEEETDKRATPEMKHIISNLLILEPKERLGSEVCATDCIKAHPVFSDICWDKLQHSHDKVTPPYLPPRHAICIDQHRPFYSYEDMLTLVRQKDRFPSKHEDHEISLHDQQYFREW